MIDESSALDQTRRPFGRGSMDLRWRWKSQLDPLSGRESKRFKWCRGTSRSVSRSRKQLRDADGRKDEFLATLAHELRDHWRPFAMVWMCSNGSGPTPLMQTNFSQ